MSLKRVNYTDQDGRLKIVLLPEGVPDEEAARGVLVGPPSLEKLELSQETEVRLNNELFHRGIITSVDAMKRKQEVIAALQATLKVDAESIVALYIGGDNARADTKSTEDKPNAPIHYRRPRKPR